MESLVFENSPLADYLEGEGHNEDNWPLEESPHSENESDNPSSNFAPRGISRFQERVRNKLPKPLDIHTARSGMVVEKLYSACSTALNARIGRGDNERFLEQFGYVIVASQLLNEHSAPSYTSAADVLSSSQQTDLPSLSTTFGLHGAAVTATTSFSVAWLLHWGRSTSGSGLNPKRVVVLLIVVPVLGILFYSFAKRQWLKYLRHQAVEAAGTFISNAQGFDSAASASVVFIQEVELVSRGYRISTPLPPISRLEDQVQTRRCLRLRRTVSECFWSMLERYVQSQNTLRPLTNEANLEKYYDIYDIATGDLDNLELNISQRNLEDQYSLRSLRDLFGKLYTARKIVLCCLLALSADGGASDVARWSSAVDEMRELAAVTGSSMTKMANILNEEDRDAPIPPSPLPTASPSPSKDHLRAQFRRLNSLGQGVRALHAKMHIVSEETGANLEKPDTTEFEASLLAQYESIGSDIRSLLQEWETGKASMLANRANNAEQSRPPSTFLPLSPTPSLGGTTAVEGSPTDALKALNGDFRPDLTHSFDDEEIFEAVVLPAVKNKRASLTRDERLARVREERVRQASAREKADASTNMLKELEMVIQQRPKNVPSKRVTSI